LSLLICGDNKEITPFMVLSQANAMLIRFYKMLRYLQGWAFFLPDQYVTGIKKKSEIQKI
jgi:hypothetical protein